METFTPKNCKLPWAWRKINTRTDLGKNNSCVFSKGLGFFVVSNLL